MLWSRSNPIVKAIATVTALILMVSGLVACDSGVSLELRIDVTGGVTSLDPQFATDSLACTVIANTMEGLVSRTADGSLIPAGAESYKVSGNRYTFVLRSDAKWSNDADITAEDYVFAFRRIFNHEVPSPYVDQYIEIANARQVYEGSLAETSLGVRAVDSHTLEITLEQPDSTFIEKLADTPAVPCNREFFDSTRARYGLGLDYLVFNGPYFVRTWDNKKNIILRPNDNYRQPPACPGVYIYTSRIIPPGTETGLDKATSARDLFEQGRSDLYVATVQEIEALEAQGATRLELQNKVWQLGFNTTEGVLSGEKVRRGLVMALDREQYSSRVPDMYGVADSLIPESAQPQGYLAPQLPVYNRQWAQDSSIEGHLELSAELGDDKLTLLVPREAELTALASYLQKQWKETLSLYINLEILPDSEVQARLASGSFDIAMWQNEAAGSDPISLLETLTSGNLRNYSRYQSSEYDALLQAANQSTDSRQALRGWESAEQFAIDAAVVSPLLTQSSYFAFGKGVSGIELVGGVLSFAQAIRIG